MSVGPVEVALDTDLDVEQAVAAVRSAGGSLVFDVHDGGSTRAETDRPRVIHRRDPVGSASITVDGDDLLVHDGRGELDGTDLLFLTYLQLEAGLHRSGMMTLHAAGVEHAGRGALLLGHSGAGKTSATLRLCQISGCRLVGNDLVVVGGLSDAYLVKGTTHLRLRLASVERATPEVRAVFASDGPDKWRIKRDLPPTDLGIEVSDVPAPVVAVVFVHVDDTYPKVVVDSGDTLPHRLNLYENALRYIRATSTPWRAAGPKPFDVYVPSLDRPRMHGPRTATLRRLLDRSQYVAGPLTAVVEHIADLLGATGSPTGPLWGKR
jgi:hypothetical protein